MEIRPKVMGNGLAARGYLPEGFRPGMLLITKGFDSASQALYMAYVQGTVFASGVVTVLTLPNKEVEQYRFWPLILRKPRDIPPPDRYTPYETLVFDFTSVEVKREAGPYETPLLPLRITSANYRPIVQAESKGYTKVIPLD
jgi:hypothetical protein